MPGSSTGLGWRKLDDGQHKPGAGTFGALLDRWIEHKKMQQRSPTTIEGYETAIKCHLKPHLGDLQLRDFSALDLDTLYGSLLEDHGLATIQKVHRVAHGALDQAVKWNMIRMNPAANASPPSVPRPRTAERTATPDDVARIYTEARRTSADFRGTDLAGFGDWCTTGRDRRAAVARPRPRRRLSPDPTGRGEREGGGVGSSHEDASGETCPHRCGDCAGTPGASGVVRRTLSRLRQAAQP